MDKNKKVVLVGTGLVGMSFAYSMIISGGLDELILIDLNKEKAVGEAMDLQHATCFTKKQCQIKAGDYADCKDADIVVITAGIIQRPDQTRLDLTTADTKIVKSVTEQIMASGFDGIIVVASNPVDLMTYTAQKVSGLPAHRVIGTGTLLDTARLRYSLSERLGVSPYNIHAYVFGEHGDSSFVPWTHACIGSKNLLDTLPARGLDLSVLDEIYNEVRQAGYEIVNRKKSTYYGIGMALNRLVQAILNNENSILTVSAQQNGEYGCTGLYSGVPAVIGRDGILEMLELELSPEEAAKFDNSCKFLNSIIAEIVDPIIAQAE